MGKQLIQITKLKPDSNQPRQKTGFGKDEMEELSNSIKQVGIIVPLLVQKDLTLIDGERRLRAAKLIGLKEVPIIYDNDLTDVQRLEYQLICSLNSTSCAEEEIAPKIKEYQEKSKYSAHQVSLRLGKSKNYIKTMINSLADLTKSEKQIIKLWRETKGEKGIAPSNLAELKQQHPEKKDEIIELAKEEIVSRSDIREIAKEKKYEKDISETKERQEEINKTDDKKVIAIHSTKIINNLRSEIVNAERDLSRFIYKVRVVKFRNIFWKNHKEQVDFAKFIDNALTKSQRWVGELERIKMEVGV
jgi:ParB family chromosome partitioning protein|tara:strand:- start:1336 stop:2244 length:909 start_codon:yes stop_codon:yes gene_type:complete